MLRDIEGGKIDRVVVYRVDRLSRSLRDFLDLLAFLDEHDVGLTSITEAFDTRSPAGRLMLNLIASFAEYERSLARERTADRIAEAKRRGKWCGGVPVLGYDVVDARLVVNEGEAERVRSVFDCYLEVGSLAATVREMARRRWARKKWVSKDGRAKGGGLFSKTNLRDLLTNPVYRGRVRHNGSVYEGEHDAIVGQKTWDAVQTKLRRNGTARPTGRSMAILRGLIHCSACDAPMIHHATRKGARLYRYYVCSSAKENGHATCPTRTVPAAEIEAFIVEQIRGIGSDRELLTATVKEARRQLRRQVSNVRRELRIARLQAEQGDDGAGQRVADLEEEVAAVKAQKIGQRDLRDALRDFDPLWSAMTNPERAEVLAALISRIDYHGGDGTVDITFKASGFEAVLARQGDGDG
jgi:site-specific DNA recombinase